MFEGRWTERASADNLNPRCGAPDRPVVPVRGRASLGANFSSPSKARSVLALVPLPTTVPFWVLKGTLYFGMALIGTAVLLALTGPRLAAWRKRRAYRRYVTERERMFDEWARGE